MGVDVFDVSFQLESEVQTRRVRWRALVVEVVRLVAFLIVLFLNLISFRVHHYQLHMTIVVRSGERVCIVFGGGQATRLKLSSALLQPRLPHPHTTATHRRIAA